MSRGRIERDQIRNFISLRPDNLISKLNKNTTKDREYTKKSTKKINKNTDSLNDFALNIVKNNYNSTNLIVKHNAIVQSKFKPNKPKKHFEGLITSEKDMIIAKKILSQ